MDEPFYSSRYSIENSKRHFQHLVVELEAFQQSDPFQYVVDVDPNTGHEVHKLKLVKPLPLLLSAIVFDAVGNLRAALDQAAHDCAIAVNPRAKAYKFPFGELAKKVGPEGGASDVPEPIFRVMASYRPYSGGDERLNAINQIANSQKHRLVIPYAVAGGDMHIGGMILWDGLNLSDLAWDSDKNEMKLFDVSGRAMGYDKLRISVCVAFSEVIECVARTPVKDGVDYMIGRTTEIVNAIQAEAEKIGLFKS